MNICVSAMLRIDETYRSPFPSNINMSAQSSAIPPQISVEELAHRLKSASTEDLQLVDVREPEEVAIAYAKGFDILPLSQFVEADEIQNPF